MPTANWQACSAWPATPALPLPSPHRSPRHRQARDHKDDPHISFADDSLPCWQEHVPEPQGQEPPGHEDVARLKRPVFAHAQWPVPWASSIGPVGMWGWEARTCGMSTGGDVPATAWSIRGLGRGGGDEVGHSALSVPYLAPWSWFWLKNMVISITVPIIKCPSASGSAERLSMLSFFQSPPCK